jgi:hypothetical protein
VPLTLGEGESAAGPWRIESLAELVRLIFKATGDAGGRPPVVAVDGRSGSGKTTIAERLRAAVTGAEVVHTDDIAWWHSRFGWDDLMISGVLDPIHRGQPVHYRPPAWEERGRPGQIDVSAHAPLVIVEGVGAARGELTHLLDAAIWVQSDFVEAERRAVTRDGGDSTAAARWHEWMAEEVPFLATDRPWERATLIIAGTPKVDHDPTAEVVLAFPLPAATA